MNSDLADATEVKAAEESAWEILTGFSLPKYAVDSLTHYKNNPESFKNEVLSGITVAVMQVPESVEATHRKIAREAVDFPSDVEASDDAKHLVVNLLQKDPMKRLSLEQVLAHPFVKAHAPPAVPPADSS